MNEPQYVADKTLAGIVLDLKSEIHETIKGHHVQTVFIDAILVFVAILQLLTLLWRHS